MTEPNALNRMFGSERPMALLMSRVKMMPEAPTRVPATISRSLSSTKPEGATAAPGQHEDHAEHERQSEDDPDVDDASGDQRQDDHDPDGRADQRVDHLLAGVGDGPSRDQLLQLNERDRAPREGHR